MRMAYKTTCYLRYISFYQLWAGSRDKKQPMNGAATISVALVTGSFTQVGNQHRQEVIGIVSGVLIGCYLTWESADRGSG